MSVSISDQSQFPRRIRFDWIGEAFSIYGKNVGVWILATLIMLAVLVGLGFGFGAYGGVITAFTHPGTPPPTMPPGIMQIYYLLNGLLTAFFYGGLFKMANKAVRGEAIGVGDLFSGANVMLPILGYNILFGLSIILGVLLCILPVFVVYTALWPGLALVADGESVGSAYSRSWNAVKQDWLNAGLFGLVVMLLILVSELPLLLGLFVTLPMMFILGGLVYRDMIGMPGAGTDNPMGGPYYAAPNPAGGVWPPAPTQSVPPATNPFPPAASPFPPMTPAPPATPSDAFPPPSDPYAPPPPSPPQSGE